MCKKVENKDLVYKNRISLADLKHDQKQLNIVSFNVENLEPKLDDPNFIDLINSHDITVLCETWRKDDSKINIQGFWDFSQIRPKIKKSGRYSGGISIFVKNDIREGVKIINSSSEGFIWIKLLKSFFGLSNDIFMCAVYIPPKGATRHDSGDYFEELSNHLVKYIDKGNIILLGDLNSRIGKEISNTNTNSVNSHSLIDNMLPQEVCTKIDSKSSCDNIINNFGKKLLSICKAFDLIVANGRCPGDMIGNFTCHTKRGASVVDLIIIDSQILNLISKVKVLPPSFVSAHSPVSFSLKCIIQKGNLNKEVLANHHAKLIWDPEKKDLIQNIFKFPMVKQEVNLINQELNSIDNNYKMLDSIIQKFCNLLILKASTCLKLKKKIVSRNVY